MQLEIEEKALSGEDDDVSKRRLENLKEELANLKKNKINFNYKLIVKKKNYQLSKIFVKNRQSKVELEQAQNSYNLEKASELQYSTLPKLTQELEELEEKSNMKSTNSKTKRLLKMRLDLS